MYTDTMPSAEDTVMSQDPAPPLRESLTLYPLRIQQVQQVLKRCPESVSWGSAALDNQGFLLMAADLRPEELLLQRAGKVSYQPANHLHSLQAEVDD